MKYTNVTYICVSFITSLYILAILLSENKASNKTITVVKDTVDSRGLYSIIYKDEAGIIKAIDYLTESEYVTLKKNNTKQN